MLFRSHPGHRLREHGPQFVRAVDLEDEVARGTLVAEIEPAVVQWMRDGLVPSVLDDARVRVEVGDVRDVVLAQPSGSLDGLLLDVDNGPDFLVYNENSALYESAFLGECRQRLAPGGVRPCGPRQLPTRWPPP